MTRTALVIGGGIAGPAAAMALQKAGIDPIVYEAQPTGADGVGAFLTLGSNGIDALRVLGVDEPAAGFPTPHIALRGATGKRLGVTSTGGSPPSRTMKRADLYALLREEALARGIRIEHGKRFVGAADTCDGVRAEFADGTEASADVLVGCDGVHSTVRRIVDPTAPAPAYAGLIGTGGYTRGVPVDAEPGGYEMIFGRRAFFGYVRVSDGEVWWFANLPRGEDELEAPDWRSVYGADAGPAVALIEATPEILPLSPIHILPHLPAWHRGRMVVVGDAAHAPSPSSGQGASLSIEDAVVLAQCLRDHSSPQAAFAAYEAARRPRVERIVKWAARVNSSKAAGRVGAMVRDAVMPAILRMTSGSKVHRRTYDFRIDWDAAAA